MRRIALALILGAALLTLGACSWNWSDGFHPKVCPNECNSPCVCCPS